MGNNVRRGFDLSEEQFKAVEDEDDAGFTTKETPSKAMRTLLDEVAAKKERRKSRPKTIAASVFSRSLSEVDEMNRTGDWSDATAGHLVALYDRMHTKCYGVDCAELGPSERYNVAMFAGTFVKREFDGDYTRAVEFMNWAWTREIANEKWRRENGRTNARRIGARLMFGGSLLSDYRVALARSASAK